MKKRFLFTIASVTILITGFVSCTNNDFEECVEKIPNAKSTITRTTCRMTAEEAQAKLDELNKKYNCDFIFTDSISAKNCDNFYFAVLENVMRKNAGLEPLSIEMSNMQESCNYIDDHSVDEIDVASTRSYVEDSAEPIVKRSGSYKSLETLEANDFSRFTSAFNRYNYSISYTYEYGPYSSLDFLGFENQTVYHTNNMPEEYQNWFDCEVEELAKKFVVTYVDSSLNLETPISYNNNYPDDQQQVSFGYSYKFKIGNTTFLAVSANNSRVISTKMLD